MTDLNTAQQPVPPDRTEIARFLTQLYPETQGGWLVLSYPDPTRGNATTGKRPLLSMWLDLAKVSLADVARHAAQLSAQDTVYFGVVLQRPDCTPHVHHRSTNAGAYHVPGLWFDLDLATGAHAASALPAIEAEGLAFLQGLQAPPSLILSTGGGAASLLAL